MILHYGGRLSISKDKSKSRITKLCPGCEFTYIHISLMDSMHEVWVPNTLIPRLEEYYFVLTSPIGNGKVKVSDG